MGHLTDVYSFCRYSASSYTADECFQTCVKSNLVGFNVNQFGWCICQYNDGSLPTGENANAVNNESGNGPVEGSNGDSFSGNCYKYNPAQ